MNIWSLKCSVRSDNKNKCRETVSFENRNVKQRNVNITELDYIYEHCVMLLQVFTVVTKLLVS
jgi:hypothetical protein